MADRLERLLNLTATLLDTRRPLTLDELGERLEPPYPEEGAARRRAFERDKETLRELGIPISVESTDAFGGEAGYRIRPEDYYLPALALDPEERAALHVAVSAVRLQGDGAREALHKLGGVESAPGADGPATAAPLASLGDAPGLGALFDAVATRRVLEIGYRGEVRGLEPYGVVNRSGHWYVVGRDRDREALRSFRVDRIEGTPTYGEPGAFEPPHDFDPGSALRTDPMAYGDRDPVEARVLVDATRAAWVLDELGEQSLVTRRDDGAVEVRLAVVNREAFRTFVLALLEHAEVLGPPELRDDVIGWLRAVAAANA